MSVHARPTPQAEARLAAQRRHSAIASLAISILAIALVGTILGFVFLPATVRESPIIVSYQSAPVARETLETAKIGGPIQRLPSAPSSSASARIVAADTVAPVAIPVPEIDFPAPSSGSGLGNDFSDGFGSGFDGKGTGFDDLPAVMRKRCSPEDRLQRLTENGGNARCEEAVIKGLQWLKSTQAADGSWGNANKPAMTGLALLCYLGHCETPLSAEFGESCLKAIAYLVNRGMSQNGRLNESGDPIQMVYEHSIATYALAEASTFCKQLDISIPNLTEVTQQAGQYIIDRQHRRSGGWDYGYADESPRGGDLSVTAWQIQALKACSHTGIPFKRITPALRKSIDYVAKRQGSDGGFGYAVAGDHATKGYNTLTGAGVLALQMAGNGGHVSVYSGSKYIEERTRFDFNTEFADLYGHYYEAQAMMNRGGEQWKKYNSLFRDQLLDNQNPDGSWKSPGGGRQIRAVAPRYVDNEHYRNCLCILMLETYYRFLPGTGENTK